MEQLADRLFLICKKNKNIKNNLKAKIFYILAFLIKNQNIMKKLSIILLASIFTLSSCSSDDEGSSSSSDLTIDGQEFTITDAKAIDNYHLFYDTTHSEFSFALADGPITVEAVPDFYSGFTTENASISMSLSMASLGNTFQNGVYQFEEFGDEDSNFSFFDTFDVYIDGNGDNDFYDPQDSQLYTTAGTVTVSGTAPNYTLAIDVTLSNDENFQYTYNGGFDYVDNRND